MLCRCLAIGCLLGWMLCCCWLADWLTDLLVIGSLAVSLLVSLSIALQVAQLFDCSLTLGVLIVVRLNSDFSWFKYFAIPTYDLFSVFDSFHIYVYLWLCEITISRWLAISWTTAAVNHKKRSVFHFYFFLSYKKFNRKLWTTIILKYVTNETKCYSFF